MHIYVRFSRNMIIIIQEPNDRNILNMSDLTNIAGGCWHANNTEEEDEREFIL